MVFWHADGLKRELMVGLSLVLIGVSCFALCTIFSGVTKEEFGAYRHIRSEFSAVG
jgi:hypothetical protein